MTEVDDLKARFEQAVALFNARDLAAWATYSHDEISFFSPHAPFALEGKEALLRAMQALVSQSESISWQIINPQFRVMGNTGVTWALFLHDQTPRRPPAHGVRPLSADLGQE
jgi:ketosteroid isomerase-like protein